MIGLRLYIRPIDVIYWQHTLYTWSLVKW